MASADVAMAALSNIAASVGIILVNKQIVSVINFHFILTLLFLNFLTTAVVLSGSVHMELFEPKHMPSKDRWLVASLAVLTVLLNNASNEANSVGFYQIVKLMIIPTVMFLERLRGVERSYSREIVLSLLVSSCGVAVATVSDFEVNLRGCILAFLSNFVTAQYQIWQSGKQHEHGLSPNQITHSVAWPQAFVGFLGMLLLDVFYPGIKDNLLLRSGGLLEHSFQSSTDILWIVLCCMIAVLMNFSTYRLLGKTSPVTYQVIGQFKTCLIITSGYLIFDIKAPAAWIALRFLGVAIAVSGILSYGFHKNRDAEIQKGKETKKA